MPLLTVTEVAHRFHVDHRTLQRWVREGRVTEHQTLLGQLRFRENEVRTALEGDEASVEADRRRIREMEESHTRREVFLLWLEDLDRPGSEERRRVTLDLIIRRARYARTGRED